MHEEAPPCKVIADDCSIPSKVFFSKTTQYYLIRPSTDTQLSYLGPAAYDDYRYGDGSYRRGKKIEAAGWNGYAFALGESAVRSR